jgi:phage terminase small subunit
MLVKMRNSNSSSSWLELVSVLNNAEDVSDIDLGQLELYSIVDENFSIAEYSNERLVPIKGDLEQKIEFSPIIKILEKHNQTVSNIKLYKGVNTNSIYFSVFFQNHDI